MTRATATCLPVVTGLQTAAAPTHLKKKKKKKGIILTRQTNMMPQTDKTMNKNRLLSPCWTVTVPYFISLIWGCMKLENSNLSFRYSHGILPFNQRHRRNYAQTMWWENRLKRYTILFRRKIPTKLKDTDIKLPDLTRCPAMWQSDMGTFNLLRTLSYAKMTNPLLLCNAQAYTMSALCCTTQYGHRTYNLCSKWIKNMCSFSSLQPDSASPEGASSSDTIV